MDAGDGRDPVIWLLAAAAILPMLGAVGVFVLIRAQNREKALKLRIASVTVRGQDRPSGPASTLIRRAPEQKPSLVRRLASLIAFDPDCRDQYKLPWFVVLGVTLVLGRVAVLMASGVAGSLAWVLLPLVTIGGARSYYSGSARKRRGLLLAQFPDALALIVRAVRVGIPVPESLRIVARETQEPTRTEFDRLQHQIAMGSPLEAALRELAARNAVAEYGFFAAVLALQAQTGGALTETLETLADIIRRRIAMKERGHALSSEARTSSYVLGGLPLVSGALMYFSSPGYISLLFTEPLGHIMLGAAALSLATGMGVMSLIIRKTLS